MMLHEHKPSGAETFKEVVDNIYILSRYAILLCLLTTACAPSRPLQNRQPTTSPIDTSWVAEEAKKTGDPLSAINGGIDEAASECNGRKLGLPSYDFSKKIKSAEFDEFYHCYKSSFSNSAHEMGERDIWIDTELKLITRQENLWRHVMEKSITPAMATKEMRAFNENLKNERIDENKY